jgi:hypothetical protein
MRRIGKWGEREEVIGKIWKIKESQKEEEEKNKKSRRE